MKPHRHIPLSLFNKYPLPDFLKGRITEHIYDNWLNAKANTIRHRDIKRGKPYALTTTKGMYKALLHNAVIETGEYDSYTGERLAYELAGEWDSKEAKTGRNEYRKRFLLMPTADHKNPDSDTLELEIVSLEVNDCKSGLDPGQFIALCKKIVAYRAA